MDTCSSICFGPDRWILGCEERPFISFLMIWCALPRFWEPWIQQPIHERLLILITCKIEATNHPARKLKACFLDGKKSKRQQSYTYLDSWQKVMVQLPLTRASQPLNAWVLGVLNTTTLSVQFFTNSCLHIHSICTITSHGHSTSVGWYC